MKVSWLIDAEMFDAYRDTLVSCIREQGHEVKLVRPPQPPYRWDDVGCSYRSTFPPEACVVTLGDIEFVHRVYREQRWTPGAFATVERFACSSYYCHFGNYLLNKQYIMLPFGELRRCRDFLFATIGDDGRIFVRPDSPLKLFTGQVVTDSTFEKDLDYMAFYDFPPESLVVVSAPREIAAEWRFVIASKRVVAGCQYKRGEKSDVQPEYDDAAFTLASEIAAGDYQPDPVWIADVCLTTDGGYHLLEIGGFSFADLYACDKNAIVAGVSAAALEVWKQDQQT